MHFEALILVLKSDLFQEAIQKDKQQKSHVGVKISCWSEIDISFFRSASLR